MSNANDQMLEMFLFEMSTLLEQLDEILLTSEKNQSLDQESVGEIFRIMHTIKGSSAMMDYHIISDVTHHLEDAFFYIRDNGIPPQHFTKLFDLMLDATEFLKSQLEAIQAGDPPAEGNDPLIARSVQFLALLTDEAKPEPTPEESPIQAEGPGPRQQSDLSSTENNPAGSEGSTELYASTAAPSSEGQAAKAAQKASIYSIEVLFDEDCGMENLRAFMLVNNLKTCCRILSMDPPDIESNPDSASHILIHGFQLVVESESSQDALQKLAEGSMHVKSAVIRQLDEVPRPSDAPESGQLIPGTPYQADIRFEDECGMENLRAFMLINTLSNQCRINEYTPADIENNPASAEVIVEHGFTILLETPLSKNELQELLDGSMYVKSANVTPLAQVQPSSAEGINENAVQQEENPVAKAPQTKAEQNTDAAPGQPTADDLIGSSTLSISTSQKQPSSPKRSTSKTTASGKPIKQNLISVSLSKLDELMDLMGELVITESMVIRNPELKQMQELDSFQKSARQLMKLTDELQDMVMSIRMVPISGTFQRMHRIVRDMCRNLGKDAELVTMGEETDIDKTIIDGIADPIMHLVRNSMDHGIETPEERMAAGKPPKATVTLSAQNTGGEILITISDDGKGMDAQKILTKAKANGLLQKPAGEYTDKEAFMLLCVPGFSTREEVTEYSGRGVGMDVVKKNIEKIGGTIVIESKKGQGTSTYLKIPLTLAIVDGMEIQVGAGVYTLQIGSIYESFKATNDQVITDTQGNEMILIRGNVYPIVRLHELYNVPDAITNIEDGILIWVQSSDKSACLFVDDLVGEQQIVVKPIPQYLKKFDVGSFGISGCTILGDGNISLILDVGRIIEKVMEKR